LAAPEVVWSLVDAGFVVIGVARQGTPTALAHSRLVTLRRIPPPEADFVAARRALADLLGEIRRDGTYRRHVLLPLDDMSVWMCSEVVHDSGWTLAGPGTQAAVALALDKRCQVEVARGAGLDTPPTVVANTVDDLETLPFGFPIILRPAKAVQVAGQRLGKGRNWICSDASELQAAGRTWGGRSPMLVQPYLDGVGEGVFGLMTPQGVVGWSAHRRLRMMNPHGSGSSACVSRQADEALKGPITHFLETVNWRGMFMIELLRGGGIDARPCFVEFNGRAWGSMALARRLGLEYPAWTVRQALGEGMPARDLPTAQEGLVCRNLGREFMHLVFVLRGRRSRAIQSWPTFWSALRDVLRPHPGGSFYNWRGNDWRVFASDCYYTILRNVFKPQRS
jgi:hypothetical protein